MLGNNAVIRETAAVETSSKRRRQADRQALIRATNGNVRLTQHGHADHVARKALQSNALAETFIKIWSTRQSGAWPPAVPDREEDLRSIRQYESASAAQRREWMGYEDTDMTQGRVVDQLYTSVNVDPAAPIRSVRWGMASDKMKKRMSVAEIFNATATSSGLSKENSATDICLGPTHAHFQKCGTCKQSWNCGGHTGHVTLPFPVYAHFQMALKLMNCVCPHCSHMLLHPYTMAPVSMRHARHRLMNMMREHPLQLLSGPARKDIIFSVFDDDTKTRRRTPYCPWCNMLLPKISSRTKEQTMQMDWTWDEEELEKDIREGYMSKTMLPFMNQLTAATVNNCFQNIPVTHSIFMGLLGPTEDWTEEYEYRLDFIRGIHAFVDALEEEEKTVFSLPGVTKAVKALQASRGRVTWNDTSNPEWNALLASGSVTDSEGNVKLNTEPREALRAIQGSRWGLLTSYDVLTSRGLLRFGTERGPALPAMQVRWWEGRWESDPRNLAEPFAWPGGKRVVMGQLPPPHTQDQPGVEYVETAFTAFVPAVHLITPNVCRPSYIINPSGGATRTSRADQTQFQQHLLGAVWVARNTGGDPMTMLQETAARGEGKLKVTPEAHAKAVGQAMSRRATSKLTAMATRAGLSEVEIPGQELMRRRGVGSGRDGRDPVHPDVQKARKKRATGDMNKLPDDVGASLIMPGMTQGELAMSSWMNQSGYCVAMWEDTQRYIVTAMDDSSTSHPYNPVAVPQSNTHLESVSQQIKGKFGLVKRHALGKRVWQSGRAVVGPAPELDAHEIGVPRAMLATFTQYVQVTELNRAVLAKSIMRGADVPHGAYGVIQGGTTHFLRDTSPDVRWALVHALEEGDVVMQHPGEGSYVIANRQPSLWRYNMQLLKVVEIDGSRVKMSLENTDAQGMDFDGDEGNIYPLHPQQLAEAWTRMTAPNLVHSVSDNSAVTGLVQDSCTGVFLLSHVDILLSPEDMGVVLRNLRGLLLSDDVLGRGRGVDPLVEAARTSQPYSFVPAVDPPAYAWLDVCEDEDEWTFTASRMAWSGKQALSVPLAYTNTYMDTGVGDAKHENILRDGEDGTGSSSTLLIRHGRLLCGRFRKSVVGPGGKLQESIYFTARPTEADTGGTVERMHMTLLAGWAALTGDAEEVRSLETVCLPAGAAVVRVLGDVKRVAQEYLTMHGASVGLQDCVPHAHDFTEKLKSEIEATLDSIASVRRDAVAARLANSRVESRELSILQKSKTNVANMVMADMVRPRPDLDSSTTNEMANMLHSGAKGSITNLMQMMAMQGPHLVGNRMLPVHKLTGRNWPFHQWNAAHPEMQGFCRRSYMDGSTVQQHADGEQAARDGLANVQSGTANGGYHANKLFRMMEGLFSTWGGMVTSGKRMVQRWGCTHGLDPSRLQCVNVTEMMNMDAGDVEAWVARVARAVARRDGVEEEDEVGAAVMTQLFIGGQNLMKHTYLDPVRDQVQTTLRVPFVPNKHWSVKTPSAQEWSAAHAWLETVDVRIENPWTGVTCEVPRPESAQAPMGRWAMSWIIIALRSELLPRLYAPQYTPTSWIHTFVTFFAWDMVKLVWYKALQAIPVGCAFILARRAVEAVEWAALFAGESVGANAAQSVSQRVTQNELSSFHHVSDGPSVSPVDRMRDVTEMRQNPRTSAMITTMAGLGPRERPTAEHRIAIVGCTLRQITSTPQVVLDPVWDPMDPGTRPDAWRSEPVQFPWRCMNMSLPVSYVASNPWIQDFEVDTKRTLDKARRDLDTALIHDGSDERWMRTCAAVCAMAQDAYYEEDEEGEELKKDEESKEEEEGEDGASSSSSSRRSTFRTDVHAGDEWELWMRWLALAGEQMQLRDARKAAREREASSSSSSGSEKSKEEEGAGASSSDTPKDAAQAPSAEVQGGTVSWPRVTMMVPDPCAGTQKAMEASTEPVAWTNPEDLMFTPSVYAIRLAIKRREAVKFGFTPSSIGASVSRILLNQVLNNKFSNQERDFVHASVCTSPATEDEWVVRVRLWSPVTKRQARQHSVAVGVCDALMALHATSLGNGLLAVQDMKDMEGKQWMHVATETANKKSSGGGGASTPIDGLGGDDVDRANQDIHFKSEVNETYALSPLYHTLTGKRPRIPRNLIRTKRVKVYLSGSDLEGVMNVHHLNWYRTVSSNTDQVSRVLGKAAAEQTIYALLREINGDIDPSHLATTSSYMMNDASKKKFNRHGVENDFDRTTMQKIQFEQQFKEARNGGMHSLTDRSSDASTWQMLGQKAPCGTGTVALAPDPFAEGGPEMAEWLAHRTEAVRNVNQSEFGHLVTREGLERIRARKHQAMYAKRIAAQKFGGGGSAASAYRHDPSILYPVEGEDDDDMGVPSYQDMASGARTVLDAR